MNLKIKTLCATLLLVASLSTSAFALTQYGTGPTSTDYYNSAIGNYEVGVSRAVSGSTTYGFSWINPDANDKQVWTKTKIYMVQTSEAWGIGYAQTNQISENVVYQVSESHGWKTN